MDPPPAAKSEAVARAIFMVRNLGFFSAHRSPGEAAVMLGMIPREFCGAPIGEDVIEFLAEHLLSARQAALRRASREQRWRLCSNDLSPAICALVEKGAIMHP